MKKILVMIVLAINLLQGGFLSDLFGNIKNERLDKTPGGYKITQDRVKTQYTGNVIWGVGFGDHIKDNPVIGAAVIVFGEGWSYTSITDDKGLFIVRVKPDSPFKLKVSNGDIWAEYKNIIAGIPKGTTGTDK